MSRKARADRRAAARGGDPDGADGPLRRCAATGASRPKAEMVRFVAGPDGRLVPDAANDLPGRGVWVTADRKAIAKAMAKGLFAKSLERAVDVPKDLPDAVERILAARALAMLGLAKRAGLVATGETRVRERLDEAEAGLGGKIAALVEARDGAEDGRRAILAKARAMELDVPVCGQFDSSELSVALGQGNVIHACLSASGGPPGLERRLLDEMRRLAGFRPLAPEAWGWRAG